MKAQVHFGVLSFTQSKAAGCLISKAEIDPWIAAAFPALAIRPFAKSVGAGLGHSPCTQRLALQPNLPATQFFVEVRLGLIIGQGGLGQCFGHR